jgi:DNA-binding CsgD family transcriptional regulator
VARGSGGGIRQDQILGLAARGSTDKEIAAALGIAVPTVRTHLDRFFRDHDVRNRTQAVALWLRATVNTRMDDSDVRPALWSTNMMGNDPVAPEVGALGKTTSPRHRHPASQS